MARGKGTANLAASLEVLAGAPLDARDVCPTVADLYVAANWPYKYIGMKTTVQATGDTYRLVNLDVTQESSWVLDGGGGSGSGGHTIEGDGTAVTDRDILNFKDMSVSDDDQNEKTDVKPHRLTQSELADIISPLPFFDFSNPGAEAFIFSTNERVIGQWIDGKPLYQKSFVDSCNIEVSGDSNQTVLDVTNLNIDTCVDLLGFYTVPNNVRIPLNSASYWSNSNKYFMVETQYRPNNVIAVHNAYNTLTSYAITLRYTKTTDRPVATGEKIVGQWIDGKTLYEKVISVNSPSTINQNTDYSDKVISNLDTIASFDGMIAGCWKINSIQNTGSGDTLTCCAWIGGSDNHLRVRVGNANFADSPMLITIRYTKT